MKKLLLIICKLFGIKHQPKPTKPRTLLTYKQVVQMLREYDNTRFEILVNNLGFEDTRINTFDFYEMKNYLNYMEEQAKEKNIKLKGISFIKGVYSEEITQNSDFVGYENLLYIPTALVGGKEKLVDVINSKKDKIITFKDKLADNGYEWKYDDSENYKVKQVSRKEKSTQVKPLMMNKNGDEELSGLANHSTIAPPYENL